jgi:enoyl-CoA hydratase/carnithine racemase
MSLSIEHLRTGVPARAAGGFALNVAAGRILCPLDTNRTPGLSPGRPRRKAACRELERTMPVDASTSQDMLYEIKDGIGWVTFNRPQARNAFTFAMYERLSEIAKQANEDKSIKVLVFQGAGDKAFASGTDINQFRAFKSPDDALESESRIDRVLGVLETCRVPTIAAINGACTGGGAGIAACCDLRIGTKTARLGFPIARTLGNCLSMSNLSRLTALVGPARVKDLIFTARLVEAPEAAAIGLLTEVVEDGAALQTRAAEMAALIANHAPLTMTAIKQGLARLMQRLTREEGEDLILMCYMSKDFREGMDAFLNKRAPQWKGE